MIEYDLRTGTDALNARKNSIAIEEVSLKFDIQCGS